MDEQDRNLTPESRLSTADLAAKNPATDHEPVQSETTSRHETSSPVMQVSRADGQTLVARDGAAASEGDQGTREQPTTAGRTAAGAGSDPEATPLFAEQRLPSFVTAGARSRLALWTSPGVPSSRRTAWWLKSCSGWPRALATSGRDWKPRGAAARRPRQRDCAWPYASTARSSTAYSGSEETPLLSPTWHVV